MLQFSEDECREIIKKFSSSKNVKIVKFESQQFGSFLGYSGEYYRFKITAKTATDDDAKEFNFFVKSLPIVDAQNRRESLISTGFFLKEVKIYKEIFSKFKEIDSELWCPNAYLLRDDLMVFDDLTLMSYQVLPSDVIWLDQRCIETTLKTLANFHACSLIYEKNEKISIGKKFGEILFETSFKEHDWFFAGIKTVLQVALKKSFVENSEKEKFYDYLKSTIQIMEKSPYNVPYAVCHRDLWKNNLMFSTYSNHCVLIDFQTARYLPLSVDLALIIFCSTEKNHYGKMINHYVNFYYKNLCEKLEKFDIDITSSMSEENLLKSCNYHKHFALIFESVLSMYTRTPKDFFNEFTDEDYLNFADGDRSSYVLKSMNENTNFDKIISDVVSSIVELYKLE